VKILREPLLHFLALGLGLFVLFALVRSDDPELRNEIVVTQARIEQIAELWSRTWQRPPTQMELEGLIEEYIREEVLYREALAMGLDENDTIVRRRLRQKIEFLTDDLTAAVEPGEEVLQAFLDANLDSFRTPARLSFEHVYLSPDRRGEKLNEDAAAILADLRSDTVERSTVGDPILLPEELHSTDTLEVERLFGKEFAERILALPQGDWGGPVESAYGSHLVRLHDLEPASIPGLEEVRAQVERDWRAARRAEFGEAFYQGLRERYSIRVETPDPGPEVEEPRP